jgi:4,4'-diaponeurosporenoate glycosyltransferase
MMKILIPFLFWLVGLFLMWNVRPVGRRANLSTTPSVPSLLISIIIPARNEEHIIGKLLSSLAGQTFKPHEIIVVDDESSDNTAVVAQTFNIKIIRGKKAENGWLGKSWACFQGAQYSNGDTLLFLDADTWLTPNGLEDIAGMYSERRGLVTVQPYHVTMKMYEQLSAFFNIVVMAGLNVFTPFGNRLKPSGGFGPCVICSRETYFALGGHEAAKSKVLEDIALARTFSGKGYNVSCYGGRGSISFRMYPDGFKSLIEGWAKGFAEGSASIRKSFLLLVILWITGCFEAFITLCQSSVFTDASLIWAAVFLYVLYAFQIKWMLRRIGRFQIWTAVLFPIPLVFFALLMVWSIIRKHFMKKVIWKDRVIQFGDQD